MKKIFAAILAATLWAAPLSAAEIDAPVKLDITGVVIVDKPRPDPRDPKRMLGNSAIVNDTIWWEGQTVRLRKDDDSWITLTLVKVELVEGKGGVCTFRVEDAARSPEAKPDTFKTTIKKKAGWGLDKK